MMAIAAFFLAAAGIGEPATVSSAAPVATPTPASAFKIRFDGFGPVKVGMKPADAIKAYGNVLSENRWDDESECYYLDLNKENPESEPSFMVNDGTVARVDVSNPEYLTEAGAKVGDTEARIKELYGKDVEVSPHEYVDGHYLTVTSKDGKYAIIFETDGKVVTYIRAGRPPEVGFIEGCS
jgi:hypothetical protein